METIGMIKDIALTAAALVGAWVALKGLNAWREQTCGKDEYALAKRILSAIYRYEIAAAHVRDPFYWEMFEDQHTSANQETSDSGGTTAEKEDHAAYERRGNELSDIFHTIWIEKIEAEILWGKDVSKLFDQLERLNHWLLYKLRVHLRPQTEDWATTEILKQTVADCDLFWRSPAESDSFTSALKEVVRAFEDCLRKHIRK